jgi:hypothetical protein
MQVEQGDKKIKLHLDHHVHERLAEHKDYTKNSLHSKHILMNQGVVLKSEECSTIPDQHKRQASFRSNSRARPGTDAEDSFFPGAGHTYPHLDEIHAATEQRGSASILHSRYHTLLASVHL